MDEVLAGACRPRRAPAARTGRARGKTSPEELAAAAHSACYAMALALRLGEHKAIPERLAITATVTLDEADGVPTIVSSHLDVTASIPGLDKTVFDAAVGGTEDRPPRIPDQLTSPHNARDDRRAGLQFSCGTRCQRWDDTG